MATQDLSPKQVSALINQLLESKDPAVVGLRKILKTKKEKGADFPLREITFDNFFVEGKSKPVFDENEKRVIELEKEVGVLQREIEQNKTESEKAIEEAYKKGVEEGRIQGENTGHLKAKEQFDKQVEDIQQKVEGIIEKLEKSKKSIYGNAQHILLRFACELAKKIIQTELQINQDVVLSVIKKALSYIADREKLTVRVAQDDLPGMASARAEAGSR